MERGGVQKSTPPRWCFMDFGFPDYDTTLMV